MVSCMVRLNWSGTDWVGHGHGQVGGSTQALDGCPWDGWAWFAGRYTRLMCGFIWDQKKMVFLEG